MLNTKSFCFCGEAAGTQQCAAVPAARVFTKASAMKLAQQTTSDRQLPVFNDHLDPWIFVASDTICLTFWYKFPLQSNSILQSIRPFRVLKRQVQEENNTQDGNKKLSSLLCIASSLSRIARSILI